MGRLIEGLWDCNYCGTKGNRGSIRECPNCGRSRDEDVKFYMPGNITYVSEEKEKTINRNPDWICPYCNSLNSDSLNICPSCGAARTSEVHDYFSIKEEQSHPNNFSNTVDNQNTEEDNDSIYEQKIAMEKKNTEKLKLVPSFIKKHWKAMLSIPVIIAIIIGMAYLFIPKNEEIVIKEFGWERSIEIEKFQTVFENGWSLPDGARLQYTSTEISHYESVLDHYETKTRQVEKERISHYESYVSGYKDLGNGYFEEIIDQRPVYETYYETEEYQEAVYRDEPVYRTKYYYEIDKWLYERSIDTNGLNQEPYWAETVLKENERISKKSQKYYITGINSKDEEQTISLDYDVWINLSVNQTIKVKVSIFGDAELIE